MRAAPAFELHLVRGRGERAVLISLGALCAAVVAVWVWSHVEVAAGSGGSWAPARVAAGVGAALLGGVLAWRLAPRKPVTLGWRQGLWALSEAAGQPLAGSVQARLDLGSWMLLRFRPADGGTARWLGVGRRQAGSGWHALRATLFAPGAGQPDEGSRA